MEFRLLGPVELWQAGRPVDIGAPRQRTVLAALLVDAGRVVPSGVLIDRVWGEAPPRDARATLNAHLSRIRRALREAEPATSGPAPEPDPGREAGREAGRLVHRVGGYLLAVEPDQVDVLRLRRMVTEAGDAGCGDGRRVAMLREAVALWRGEPLAGLSGAWVDRTRRVWCQQHLDLVVAWAHAELRAGNPTAVIGPLIELADEHPLAESVVAALMQAFDAAGQTADALDLYADMRRRLVDELGADPGQKLQAVHRRLLRGQPVPPASAPWRRAGHEHPVPRQLPPAVPDLMGRATELSTLTGLLAVDPAGTAVALAAICGPAGVGKTALAVHWARRVRHRYPDGQLYVNLRGYGPGPPQAPAQVLDQFLRDLAVPPDQVPAEIDARTALFRSLLADRQVLILLDNARDADQVRPLLPGGAACSVLVTSRSQLRGLRARDGATPVAVPRLGAADASRLLATIIGAATIAAEPDAAGQIVEYCDGLPLALGIVGERAARRPGLTLCVLADELADARGRLDALDTGDGDRGADLRAVLSWSYRTLPALAAQLFRRLSLHPGTDIDRHAAACLAGLTEAAAAKVLDTLASVHLIEDHGAGRYQLHDLLRSYAGECVAAQECEHEREAATIRLFHWYLRSTDAAIRVLRPKWTGLPLTDAHAEVDGSFPAGAGGAPDASTLAPLRFPSGAAALTFLDTEWANLAAVIRQASQSGPRPVAWLLTERLRPYVTLRQHIRDLLPTTRAALTAAQAAEDRQAEVVCRLQLGIVLSSAGEGTEAIGHFSTARDMARAHGWPLLESDACVSLGIAYARLGRLDEAARHLRLARSGYRELNLPAKEGSALGNLGELYWAMGRLERSAECCAGSLRLVRRTGDRVSEGCALTNLGVVSALRGQVREALDLLSRAGETYRQVGDRSGPGAIHVTLAELCAAAGRAEEAHDHATVAVTLAREACASLEEAYGLNSLGAVLTSQHRPVEAAAAHAQALLIAEDAGERYPQCQAHLGLARARLAQEQLGPARAAAAAALAIARATGYRLLEGLALTADASIRAAAGELDDAADLAGQALAVHRGTGHRHGEARTLLVLGELLAERGDHPGSQAHRRRAEEILGSLRAPRAPWPNGSWVDDVPQAPGQS